MRAYSRRFRPRPRRVPVGAPAQLARSIRALRPTKPAAAAALHAASRSEAMGHSTSLVNQVIASAPQSQQRVCPGRKIVFQLSPVGNLLSYSSGSCRPAYVGNNLQHIDPPTQTDDAILGIATFSAAPALLSVSIYKICTPPSTGNVDNVPARALANAPKPLSGAVFGGPPHSPS